MGRLSWRCSTLRDSWDKDQVGDVVVFGGAGEGFEVLGDGVVDAFVAAGAVEKLQVVEDDELGLVGSAFAADGADQSLGAGVTDVVVEPVLAVD